MGERIKKQREKAGMPLSELAHKVGVSPSCLSQIENIKSFPSIFTLKKIANILNTTISSLLGENENLIINPLVRSKEKRFVENINKNASLYLLSHHDHNKQMEVFFIQLNRNGVIDNFMKKHPGQSFLYLLKGKIALSLNENKYTLDKGSSFYIKTRDTLQIRNLSQKGSEILFIITPPAF